MPTVLIPASTAAKETRTVAAVADWLSLGLKIGLGLKVRLDLEMRWCLEIRLGLDMEILGNYGPQNDISSQNYT